MPEPRWRPGTPSATETPFGLGEGEVPALGYSRAPIPAGAWSQHRATYQLPTGETTTRRDVVRETLRVYDISPKVVGIVEDDDTDYAGWYCLNTLPFPCPAEGCDYVAEFFTAGHLILVWPAQDDRELLRHARRGAEVGRSPRVREYDPDFGPCVSYYRWKQMGEPVHGIRRSQPPAWWRP